MGRLRRPPLPPEETLGRQGTVSGLRLRQGGHARSNSEGASRGALVAVQWTPNPHIRQISQSIAKAPRPCLSQHRGARFVRTRSPPRQSLESGHTPLSWRLEAMKAISVSLTRVVPPGEAQCRAFRRPWGPHQGDSPVPRPPWPRADPSRFALAVYENRQL